MQRSRILGCGSMGIPLKLENIEIMENYLNGRNRSERQKRESLRWYRTLIRNGVRQNRWHFESLEQNKIAWSQRVLRTLQWTKIVIHGNDQSEVNTDIL